VYARSWTCSAAIICRSNYRFGLFRSDPSTQGVVNGEGPSFSRVSFYGCGIIALFLVPIALDIAKGPNSNLHLIFRHFAQYSEDHKTFAQSALYLLTYVYYLPNPEQYCDRLSRDILAFLWASWSPIVVWLVLIIGVSTLWRATKRDLDRGTKRFVYCLVGFFIVGVVLTGVWGKMQNGRMFGFNSRFNFGLLFLPFVVLAILLSCVVQINRIRYISLILWVLSFP
jgi:hypothetical protein